MKITKDEKQIIIDALKTYCVLLSTIIENQKTILLDELKLQKSSALNILERFTA